MERRRCWGSGLPATPPSSEILENVKVSSHLIYSWYAQNWHCSLSLSLREYGEGGRQWGGGVAGCHGNGQVG